MVAAKVLFLLGINHNILHTVLLNSSLFVPKAKENPVFVFVFGIFVVMIFEWDFDCFSLTSFGFDVIQECVAINNQ